MCQTHGDSVAVLWNELVVTLRRKFGLTLGDLPVLALYRRHANWCDPAKLAVAVCRDPDDDGFWPPRWPAMPRRSSPVMPTC